MTERDGRVGQYEVKPHGTVKMAAKPLTSVTANCSEADTVYGKLDNQT